jgi:peptide/nickel transport system substrate-binding protein
MSISSKARRGRLSSIGAGAAAIAAAALVLTGCTGSPQATSTPENVAQDLTIGLPVATIANLDPFGANALVQGNIQVAAQIFDTVVTYHDGEYTPSIATEWTSSDDAKQWTFTIRDGVTFSDGSALDASDVKASMDQVVALAGPLAGIFKPLTATVVSPTELSITSEAGQGALLGKMSMLAVGPSELVATDTFGLQPVGSGPFVVDSFDPSAGVELSANPDYWNGAPKLETLAFRMIPEQSARSTALETGEIQLTWTVPDDEVDTLSANPDLVVESTPTLANLVLWFNSSRAQFADAAVRQALWQAVDYQAIIDALYPNTGQAMAGPLPEAVFGASEQTPYEFDPDAAKSALEDAGWDFDQTIKILMTANTYQPFVEAVIADWAKIGVKAEVDLQEAAVGTQNLLALNWDVAIIQPVITSTGDADYNLGRLYPCAAKRTGYCNPDLDTLLAEAGSSPDQAAREDLYDQAGGIIWDEAVGMFPMTVVQVWAWSSALEGVQLDPIYKPNLTQVQFTR